MPLNSIRAVIKYHILRYCLGKIRLDNRHPHGKHLHHALLIPRQKFRVGKIKTRRLNFRIRRGVKPGGVSVPVFYKIPLFRNFLKRRRVLPQIRIIPETEPHAALLKPCNHTCRVRETLLVPLPQTGIFLLLPSVNMNDVNGNILLFRPKYNLFYLTPAPVGTF